MGSMIVYYKKKKSVIIFLLIIMNTDISKPQFHHNKLKCYCSMPVDVPALGKRKSLLTRNSRCRCTFHICVLVSLEKWR